MAEVLRSHLEGRRVEDADLRARVVDALRTVGIPDADDRFANYPHEFSGGMRQRIIIAMALLLKPALLAADEPTSSLDVTLEAQILELLRQLRDREGTAILFVSHDLGVIAQLCDRVVIVMYAGRVVEENNTIQLFDQPMHPYTRALIECLPSRLRRGGRLATIPGVVPSFPPFRRDANSPIAALTCRNCAGGRSHGLFRKTRAKSAATCTIPRSAARGALDKHLHREGEATLRSRRTSRPARQAGNPRSRRISRS